MFMSKRLTFRLHSVIAHEVSKIIFFQIFCRMLLVTLSCEMDSFLQVFGWSDEPQCISLQAKLKAHSIPKIHGLIRQKFIVS